MEETEIWKDIPEYEGLYQVSNMGNVKSLNYNHIGKEGILKLSKSKKGYLYVILCKNGKRKNFQVHRLVAQTFLKNNNNFPCVNHKDENPSNNYVDNLEFCTYLYNNNYGTKRERLSKAKKGKFHTEETKQKISEATKGKPHYKERKPILQYTLLGEFVRYWDSAKSASIELNINRGNIVSCCKGKRKSSGGYLWKYK